MDELVNRQPSLKVATPLILGLNSNQVDELWLWMSCYGVIIGCKDQNSFLYKAVNMLFYIVEVGHSVIQLQVAIRETGISFFFYIFIIIILPTHTYTSLEVTASGSVSVLFIHIVIVTLSKLCECLTNSTCLHASRPAAADSFTQTQSSSCKTQREWAVWPLSTLQVDSVHYTQSILSYSHMNGDLMHRESHKGDAQ